jgi:hypothetical protein
MKTFYFALGFCTFAATGCIIESHPANSTPETAPSSSAAPEPTAPGTPATEPAGAPTAKQHGVPPAMREAPKAQ